MESFAKKSLMATWEDINELSDDEDSGRKVWL
jgi:hypothetical protein